ncbi:MAG: ArsR/SmtB family transcription factor [Alphaproteobacteria bacterium]
MDVKAIEHNVSVASRLLKSLSNEKRLLIICTLYKGEKSVGELEQIIGLSQSALSQHLAKLRRENVVTTRRVAQTIYYSVLDEAVSVLLEALHDVYCNDEDKA